MALLPRLRSAYATKNLGPGKKTAPKVLASFHTCRTLGGLLTEQILTDILLLVSVIDTAHPLRPALGMAF